MIQNQFLDSFATLAWTQLIQYSSIYRIVSVSKKSLCDTKADIVSVILIDNVVDT